MGVLNEKRCNSYLFNSVSFSFFERPLDNINIIEYDKTNNLLSFNDTTKYYLYKIK